MELNPTDFFFGESLSLSSLLMLLEVEVVVELSSSSVQSDTESVRTSPGGVLSSSCCS